MFPHHTAQRVFPARNDLLWHSWPSNKLDAHSLTVCDVRFVPILNKSFIRFNDITKFPLVSNTRASHGLHCICRLIDLYICAFVSDYVLQPCVFHLSARLFV